MSAPAGWHRQYDGRERFWNGTTWTDQVRDPNGGKWRRWGRLKHLIGYPIVALIALGIGASGGSGGAAPVSAASTPTVTQTITGAPGPTVTSTVSVPGPVKTVISPKPAKTVTVRVTPPPVTAFSGDGLYQVGVDIAPGTYRSAAPNGSCYWARLSGPDTTQIIDNTNTVGPSVVVIQPSDKFFETNGCSDWTHR